MKVKELKAIKESTEDYEQIEKRILELFRQEIYYPILKELGMRRSVVTNSMDDLLAAIKSGKIYFSRGHFKGKFSASTTRELRKIGGEWDRKQGSFKIPLSKIPADVRIAISSSESAFMTAVKRVDSKLAQLLPENIADKLNIEKLFDSTLYRVDQEFKKTTKGITVAPDLTKEARAKIAAEYTNNMKLYIKEWTEKNIVDLRKEVIDHANKGLRQDALAEVIQKNYGVSQGKAKFLARQETSLMMTKFKETRYLDAGVREYKWGCVAGSPNHPVRPMHKALEGKIFRWDDPPVTDEKGNRNNPGQDYNCRCFARPIVRMQE